jgi:ring-1,2-phenylacetyl-CoA epoxidase subunit PaaE
MSLHFHPIRVKEVKKETNDCVSVLFDIPAELTQTFRFTQGQSLTLRTNINGEEVRRTYSLCSSPLDNEWKVAIKLVEGGLFSTYANHELKKGDILDIMPPVGKFYTELHSSNKKSYVAFAAGSGITPILSIIKTTLRTEPNSQFTLVFGNRNKASIIFKEELEALKDKFMDRFRIIHILSRERTEAVINHGRINADKCETLFSKLINLNKCDEFFICGPEEMIFSVKGFLEARGIDKKKIHFELFTTPGQKSNTAVSGPSSAHNEPKSKVSVKLDGITFDFDLGFNESNILDAALQQGADLPYACKGGMCCTCKAKLVEGEVVMDVHWGLDDEEVEKGYILTCQSHPKTEKVVVDFDAK